MAKKENNIDVEGVNEVISLSKKMLRIFYIVLIIAVVLGVYLVGREVGIFATLNGIIKVLSPLFIGFIIAWLFNPTINKLHQKGLSKILSTIIVYLIFVLFLIIFFRMFIPLIYNQINQFIELIPNILNKLTTFINETFDKMNSGTIDLTSVKNNLLSNMSNYASNITSSLPGTIINIVKSFFSGIWVFLIGILIGLYMSFDFDNLTNQIVKVLPVKYRFEFINLLQNIGIEVRKCVNGTLLVALMVFICDTVGFAVIGLDAALLFGLFCGITDLIPYIGPYLGTGIATIVGLTQSPVIGIGVLIIAIVVQLVESYVLQPMVMSKATKLHPVVIIVGLLVFGSLFGIVGMIFATPIMAIIKVIYLHFADKYHWFGRKGKIKEK